MSSELLIAIVILAPFIGFLFNGARFKSPNYKLAGTVATAAVGHSFLAVLGLYFNLLAQPPEGRIFRADFFNWLTVGNLSVKAGFVFDPISAVMCLVITGVGTLIHIFSIGYMSHDERPTKYFAYLNFFVFNMLLLVLGENLLVMFVGWEGVGLASYLLIGFWFKDSEKAAAGMKAFITNRIGDAGFLLGMFVIFVTFGTLSFTEIGALLPATAEVGWTGPLTLACLLLFVGATGKSAQIPLYVWLPDAMAGPTPVSALIHAATMVTAGVYLIVRMNGVFLLAPNAMLIVAIVGATTALVAATIGLTQWDIKKVLAYSTVSQLGYMFLGCGVGAFMPALFHLMTHAFFKALMFLGSGSVIHAMHEEQDIRKMGGLAKYMPITHATFVLGWLAIIGMPPFAGFFSKDEILWYSFASPYGSKALWFVGFVAAICTAFYMTRLMALTFWGKSRVPKDVHPHESPITMTLPLIVLGILSIVGGWIGLPHVISAVLPGHPPNLLESWTKPLIGKIELLYHSALLEWSLMGVSVGAAGVSACVAYIFYCRKTEKPAEITKKIQPIYELVSKKYLVDEAYFAGIISPLVELSKGIWNFIDVNFIDKVTYWITDVVQSAGGGVRAIQNGNLQQYALYVALGVVGTIIFMFVG